MEHKKDYSLLRPFDLEAAKAGEPICLLVADKLSKFIAGPDKNGYICVESSCGVLYINPPKYYTMAPLCWVEGKPVYKGDVLYRPHLDHGEYVADQVMRDTDGDVYLYYENGGSSWIEGPADMEDMCVKVTWTKPVRKVKKEGWIAIKTSEKPQNVLCKHWCSHICCSKEDADKYYGEESSVSVRVEWEEEE